MGYKFITLYYFDINNIIKRDASISIVEYRSGGLNWWLNPDPNFATHSTQYLFITCVCFLRSCRSFFTAVVLGIDPAYQHGIVVHRCARTRTVHEIDTQQLTGDENSRTSSTTAATAAREYSSTKMAILSRKKKHVISRHCRDIVCQQVFAVRSHHRRRRVIESDERHLAANNYIPSAPPCPT